MFQRCVETTLEYIDMFLLEVEVILYVHIICVNINTVYMCINCKILEVKVCILHVYIYMHHIIVYIYTYIYIYMVLENI